jgi:methylenetetrahydrofolate dehydrogenase (NADP+)/methenyltetrahydrofolate cyclohydrolase
MAAVILDGTACSRGMRAELAVRARRIARAGHPPGLAVVVVGNDPAFHLYVGAKARACAEVGLRSSVATFDADADLGTVLEHISRLNADRHVDGILVQSRLPPQLDRGAIMAAIAPEKDVDGLHRYNLGALVAGGPTFRPCTPQGVMALLDAGGVEIAGREAVVIGRSATFGKPMALMLLARQATVTVCASRTGVPEEHMRRADVLVVAAGKPGLVRPDMVKPGAAVVDAGIHRLADGRLCGDVDFDGVRERAGHISPVPGGVGPMTVTMLLANTVRAAEWRAART